LLDQAIAHGGGKVAEAKVRDMLGLADRLRVYGLFETLMKGEVAKALGELRAEYDLGIDPVVVLQDLLELSHLLTRIKVAAEGVDLAAMSEDERKSARHLADTLSIPTLSRAWQMLLKGLRETREAPSPIAAAEMALIRLSYAADLPSPADLVRKLDGAGSAMTPSRPLASTTPSGGTPPRASFVAAEASAIRHGDNTLPSPAPETRPSASAAGSPIRSFADLVAMADAKGEAILHANLIANVRPVRFDPPRFEFRPTDRAPRHLSGQIKEKLAAWTGMNWVVAVSSEPGDPTIAEKKSGDRDRVFASALEDPLIRSALELFPGAELRDVREVAQAAEEAPIEPPSGEDET